MAGYNFALTTAFRYWAAGSDGSSIGHVGGTEKKTCPSMSENVEVANSH